MTGSPSKIYNAVPILECTSPLPADERLQIGEILIRHGHDREWGICRMHRHHDLDLDEIMVHHLSSDERTDVCKPVESSQDTEVYPHSWRFTHDGEFIPYEYSNRMRPRLSLECVLELQERLRIIESGLGVSFIPLDTQDEDQKWVETVDDQNRSMTSTLVSDDFHAPEYEVVAWRFVSTASGAAKAAILRECKKQPTGSHKAIYK
ncbi:hypothetical protein KCU66_g75, partial [Aureobasidium melanogenum]